jgi:hypothetical protein
MSGLQKWRKDGKHLPGFMRDFHDQKDLFKTIHNQYELYEKQGHRNSPSWVDAQIYVIDSFLWFMAGHGYTLQRCRANQEFLDLHNTMAYWKKKHDEAFAAMLTQRASSQGEISDER